jgi:lactoylglutathione lyase
MKFNFGYTGIRVRDLDKAVDFFTKLLGMKVQARIPAPWHKGEFVNLVSRDKKHWLELNWYADDSPVAGPFSTGEQLDHLGFEVDDFDGVLKRLNDAGYPTIIGPRKAGEWEFAFVKGVDDVWLDVYKITRKRKKRVTRKRKK